MKSERFGNEYQKITITILNYFLMIFGTGKSCLVHDWFAMKEKVVLKYPPQLNVVLMAFTPAGESRCSSQQHDNFANIATRYPIFTGTMRFAVVFRKVSDQYGNIFGMTSS
jgi:hypothetical protein